MRESVLTVNQVAMPERVRILPFPPLNINRHISAMSIVADIRKAT